MSKTNVRTFKSDLTRASLESLLRRLDPDPNRAGEEYETIRLKLIRFFEWNSCTSAEDLADEAFDRTSQRIHEVEVGDVVGFVWGVAKKLLREAQRRAGRASPISDFLGKEHLLTDERDVEGALHERMDRERRAKCLQCCLEKLRLADRELFLSYHESAGHQVQHRQELAASLGLTIGALRVKINRLRNGLEKCVGDCLAYRGAASRKQVRSAQQRIWTPNDDRRR